MTRVPVAPRCSLQWLGLALVVGLALQGCGARAPSAGSTAGGIAGEAPAEVPPGAIPIGSELYQLPIGADDDGCPRYRLYSPTRLVAQVIYYRNPAGGFTTDKQQADCVRGAPD